MYRQIEDIFLKSLQIILQSLGENTMFTAKTYSYIGNIFVRLGKNAVIFKFFLF